MNGGFRFRGVMINCNDGSLPANNLGTVLYIVQNRNSLNDRIAEQIKKSCMPTVVVLYTVHCNVSR